MDLIYFLNNLKNLIKYAILKVIQRENSMKEKHPKPDSCEYKEIEKQLKVILDHVVFVIQQGREFKQFKEEIMANVDDLKAVVASNTAKVGELTDATSAALAEVSKDVADLNAQIQALKDQIGAGNVITQADLDALVEANTAVGSGIDAVVSALHGVDPVPGN